MKERPEKTLNEYLEDIRLFYETYHKVPTRAEFAKIPEFGSPYTTANRFGKNWIELLSLAGVCKKRVTPFKDMGKTEILNSFIQQYQALDPKNKKDFDNHSDIKSYHYISHLKMTWKEMVEAAGGSVETRRRSDAELLEMYATFSLSIGEKHGASIRQINESDAICNYSIFQKRFSRLKNLKRLAGLLPDEDSVKK